MTRSESVRSATGSSRANSPPPKKRVSEDKEDKKTKEDTSEKSSMEHSGGINERKGDQKVDFSNQCNIGETGELNDLKMNPARSREEVSELKKEKVQLKVHNARKHASYEAELNEILIDKERFKMEVVKLQLERDLLLAKVTSMENDNDANEVDECIKDMGCEGNCLHVGCSMTQLQRLNFLKNQGGRRNSPAERNTNSKLFYCPQCNFKSNQEKEIENHVQREHDTCTSCPFCLVGFQNQIALQRHVENKHKENTGIIRERQQSFRERRISFKKEPCIFFIQPRGCKKGPECNFSHDLGAQYTSVKVKIFVIMDQVVIGNRGAGMFTWRTER